MLYALLKRLVRYAATHGVPADTILARARTCSILPYLYAAVRHDEISSDDIGIAKDALDKKILAFRIEQTAKLGYWHYSLDELVRALGTEHIVLKGAPLGQRLMDDEIWRNTSDIDLWVPLHKREEALANCQKLGYRVAVEPHLWATNQVILTHEKLAPVEIHWALAPAPWISPSFEAAYARSQIVTSPRGQAMRVLGDEDLYVHLLLHAHQHYFALKTLCDLAASLDKLDTPDPLLKACHLQKLDRFARGLIQAILSDNCSPKAYVARAWFDPLLTETHRGSMIFAEGSERFAPVGVALRAASMCLLDGPAVAADAAMQVVFCGPHVIGQHCYKPYQAIRRQFSSFLGLK